ncbi:hypothetical protein J6590_098275, partial [Homalodisca vitripennis]
CVSNKVKVITLSTLLFNSDITGLSAVYCRYLSVTGHPMCSGNIHRDSLFPPFDTECMYFRRSLSDRKVIAHKFPG